MENILKLIKKPPRNNELPKISNKIKGCIVTDHGIPGKYYNCIETYYNVIEDIANLKSLPGYLKKHDLFFINATPESLKSIPLLKQEKKFTIIFLECSGAFRNHDYLKYYDYINSADLVLTQFGDPYLSILESYFDVPMVFFGVPADIEYISNFTKNIKKEKKIHCWDLSGRNEFNSQTNFALCKKFEGYKVYSSSIHPVFKKYLDCYEIGVLSQYEYWKFLASCSLSINMMDRITWGRHYIECCAVKTPIISSYCGAADLCGLPYRNEYDLSDIEKINFDRIKILQPDVMKEKLKTIIQYHLKSDNYRILP